MNTLDRELLIEFLNLSKLNYHRLALENGRTTILISSQVIRPLMKWLATKRIPHRINKSRVLSWKIFRRLLSRISGKALHAIRINALSLEDDSFNLIFYDRISNGLYRPRLKKAIQNCSLDSSGPFLNGTVVGEPFAACTVGVHSKIGVIDHLLKPIVDVDVVYTWVDSADERWRRKKNEYVPVASGTSVDNELRYISRNELKFSIRSVLKHAPWVRKIFVVTDAQIPLWLKDNDRIVVVDHKTIFPNQLALPVFNSHAIECNLHRIPKLAEHYLYFNDDVFLGKDVTIEDFFDADGRPAIFPSRRLSFDIRSLDTVTLATDFAFRRTLEIISRDYSVMPICKMQHTPHPMSRTIVSFIEKRYSDLFEKTSFSKIRHSSDLNLCGNFFQHFCLANGLCHLPINGKGSYSYINTGQQQGIVRLNKLLKNPTKYFCLNLTDHNQVSLKRQERAMAALLEGLYPTAGSHEHDSNPR